jgi:hypothetical protein
VHYEFYSTQNSDESLSCLCKTVLKALTIDSANSTAVTCNGAAMSSHVVVASGVTPLLWSTGEITESNSTENHEAGTYSVVIKDFKQCS